MHVMFSQGMFNNVPSVRQRTIELKRRIQESAAHGAASTRTRRVLIAEPGPPAWPERVLGDPVLESVDKMVWMVLRQSATRGRFPSYAQIGRAANVSSKSTVSRAIAILRTTRWLARCGERGMRGASHEASREVGVVVYALHDAPLSVPDTLYLDSSYLTFLQFAQAHPHARVRKVVQDILASLQDSVDERIPLSSNAR